MGVRVQGLGFQDPIIGCYPAGPDADSNITEVFVPSDPQGSKDPNNRALWPK